LLERFSSAEKMFNSWGEKSDILTGPEVKRMVTVPLRGGGELTWRKEGSEFLFAKRKKNIVSWKVAWGHDLREGERQRSKGIANRFTKGEEVILKYQLGRKSVDAKTGKGEGKWEELTRKKFRKGEGRLSRKKFFGRGRAMVFVGGRNDDAAEKARSHSFPKKGLTRGKKTRPTPKRKTETASETYWGNAYEKKHIAK